MVTLQRIGVLTGTEDRDGYLVLQDGDLAGVIVRLDDPIHEGDVGKWFLEAGFGPRHGREMVFDSLDSAVQWFDDGGESPGNHG